MKKEEVSPFHIAIVDAIMALSRKRIGKGDPYFIERPRARLFVQAHQSLDGTRTKIARVDVACDTWGSTTITVELCKDNPGGWLAWGDVVVRYGKNINPTIVRYIVPSFVDGAHGAPMRYLIRTHR